MKKISLIISSVLFLSVLTSLSGCGQRGPLYLPEKKPAPVASPAPKTTAPEQTQDDKK